MAINRSKFFDGIRNGPFPGSLTPDAVRGISAILDEWERRGLTDLRWLAYMLATVMAECGRNMLPVREGFKKTDAEARAYVASKHYKYAKVVNGQVYYGRGLVQLTWDFNYAAMSKITGIDLVNNPDRALEPAVASKIMFEGMIRGTFTGKKLGDFFNATTTDWTNARKIINGLDRAGEIAGYGKQFHADLVAASTAALPNPPIALPAGKASEPVPKTPAQTAKENGTAAAVIAGGGGILYAAATWFQDHFVLILIVLVALGAAGFLGWHWWKSRQERETTIADAGLMAVAGALEQQPAQDADDIAESIAAHAKAKASTAAVCAAPTKRRTLKRPNKRKAKKRAAR